MNIKIYYKIVAGIFTSIAILHALRLFYGWEATLGGATIPLWMSGFGVAIAGYLAFRGWQFAKSNG